VNLAKKLLKYPNRIVVKDRALSSVQQERISELEQNGYVLLENFIEPDLLKEMQSAYHTILEKKCVFELPCLAQTKINEEKHSELINNYFKYSPNELLKYDVTFDKGDFDNYQTIVSKFMPSTLKTYLTNIPSFFPIWLNREIIEIVEGYMGLRPYLLEAYLRRNFPAKYKVMNHFWHRDTNNLDYTVKAFFFLSDCQITSGPHEYVSGSIADKRLSGKPYYTDQEVDDLYPPGSSRRVTSVVKAGTVIIEDTRGLHRATVPQEGYRDLGFAVFLPITTLRKYHIELKRHLGSYYDISKQDYENLTEKQRGYIPKFFIR